MSSGTMERILRLMAEKKASDVYLSAHAPAMIKINGQTLPINSQVMPPEAPLNLLSEIVPPTRIEELRETGELNMAVPLAGVGNFRTHGVDAHGHACGHKALHDRDDAAEFLLDGDAPGSGTCGLAPHIDEVSAFGMQPAPALHPRGGIRPPASVGEGVGSDIEDAHDERAIEIGKGPRKATGSAHR